MKTGKYIKIFLAIIFLLPGVTVVHALDYHKDATDGERCDWCHGTHNAFDVLLNEGDSETLCLTCHEPGVDSVAPDATVHAPLSSTPITCVGCHGTHSNKVNHLDNTNTSLVLTSVMDSSDGTYYNVEFDAATTRFADFSDRDTIPGARQICQVCHIAPPFDKPHVSSPIATEDNCINCHKHNNGFSPGGGT